MCKCDVCGYHTRMKSLRELIERGVAGTVPASEVLECIRNFPVADLETLTLGRPALVVAPHADDESLGCGGLIAESRARGHVIHIVIVTDGSASHPGSLDYPKEALIALRQAEAIAAAGLLGVAAADVSFLGLPDGGAPHSGRGARAAAGRIATIAREIGAATIFTAWRHDSHPDHVASARYCRRAARQTGAALFAYPVWGWMLPPTVRITRTRLGGFALDVTGRRAVKHAAVYAHRSQTSDLINDVNGFRLATNELDSLITDKEYFIAETLRMIRFDRG